MNEAAGVDPSFHDDCLSFEAQIEAAVGRYGENCQALSCWPRYFSAVSVTIANAAASSHPQQSDAGVREVQWRFPGQALLRFGKTHISQSTYEKGKSLGKR